MYTLQIGLPSRILLQINCFLTSSGDIKDIHMAQLVPVLLSFVLLFSTTAAGSGFLFKLSRPGEPDFTTDSQLANASPRKSSSGSGFQAQLRFSDDGVFVVKLAVGTPASDVSLIINTADSFVWTDCQPCTRCFQHSPKASAYYSNQSSTFHTLPCNSPQCQVIMESATCTPQCQYNNSLIQGILANDTFGLDGSSTDPFTVSFGCNKVDLLYLMDSSGAAGLGRGPLSLVSQLSVSKFSYCFTGGFNTSLSSYMFFGSYADLDSSVTVNTTSFVQDLHFYYLNFTGISVGATLLSIPPETFQYVANSSGTIITTGTPYTFLPQQAYGILKKELISQTGLSVYNNSIEDIGLDLCFHWPSDPSKLSIPIITFHFAGADMTLPVDNFLPNNGTLGCLTMIPTKSNYFFLGSVQQQNFQFIYDLSTETLSFRSFQCDQLPPRRRN